MKRYIITLCLILGSVGAGFAEAQTDDPEVNEIVRMASSGDADAVAHGTIDQLWDAANTAYINADYDAAIRLYDSIRVAGYTGHKLYYNLGNAWFKRNEIGRSVLYFNKALKLRPSDADTEHNLKVANTFVKDKIEKVPVFFLKNWVRELRMAVSSNGWAVLSLVFLGVAGCATLVYLLAQRIPIRKSGFYTAIVMLAFFIFAVAAGSVERRELVDSRQAIVMISAAAVKSSPEKSSKDIFVLHEGTKVHIVRTLGEWFEISIADGNKGWIQQTSIEKI